jgi:glycosyltransferase involved in cell wall biosynthesis
MRAAATPAGSQIVILHYSAPPIVGGVETTIYHHARLLAACGFAVNVLAGRGRVFHPRVAFHRLREMDSRHPRVLAVKEELDRGEISAGFLRLRDRIADLLRPHLTSAQVCIGHNLFTLHKNLPLTAALYQLLVEEGIGARVLAWHHDLAWRRPQYVRDLHPGYPWDLLRQPWPGVVQVTVSEPRRREVAALYGLAPTEVAVVPPGVDIGAFLGWSEMTTHIVEEYGLLDAELLLLLPARITRRKNIQLAVKALAALREATGLDARLVVTGPPGPHNPSNVGYLSELLGLRRSLGLAGAAHFVYELGTEHQPMVPDQTVMRDLYGLADAMLFPSQEEGFGIPVLEAGLMRLPVFCSRIPALEDTGGDEAHYFAPDASAAEVAEVISSQLLREPAFRLRRRVMCEYTWERILTQRMLPLLAREVRIP